MWGLLFGKYTWWVVITEYHLHFQETMKKKNIIISHCFCSTRYLALLPLAAGDRGRARGNSVGHHQRASGADPAPRGYQAAGEDAKFATAVRTSAAGGASSSDTTAAPSWRDGTEGCRIEAQRVTKVGGCAFDLLLFLVLMCAFLCNGVDNV